MKISMMEKQNQRVQEIAFIKAVKESELKNAIELENQ